MSQLPQFRLGCVFWLTAAVAFLLWAIRTSQTPHEPLSFSIFVVGVLALILWGARQISEKR